MEMDRHFRNRAATRTVCGAVLMTCLTYVNAEPARALEPVPIPELAQWETHMTTFGQQYCTFLGDTSKPFADLLAATDYDAERVYYQINTYTGDPSWKYCAQLAEAVYRDRYVRPKNGWVASDRLFTLGLVLDYERQADELSKDAVLMLLESGVYTSGTLPDSLTQSYRVSREVAYALMAFVDGQRVGFEQSPKFETYVTQSLGYIDQWFQQRLWEADGGFPYQPAAVGLTLQALIRAHQATPDTRIPEKVKEALDGLWNTAWRPAEQAFFASSDIATVGDPTANLLIAPAFAWYYHETGDPLYRDRGDQVFAGGVRGASLAEASVFHQQYMWSVDYVGWRKAGDSKYAAPSTPPPAPPSDLPGLSKRLKRKVEHLLNRAERLLTKADRLDDRAQELADRRPRKAERLERVADYLRDKADGLKDWAQSIVDGTKDTLKNVLKSKP